MKNKDKKILITTLIDQHRELHKCIESILRPSKKVNIENATWICGKLDKFSSDLSNHLRIENTVFYPELLRDMEAKGQDTNKTKKFIAEMDDIGKVIYGFLDKYGNVEKISVDISKFNAEIVEIGTALRLRTEVEEDGVFVYWEVIQGS